MNDINYNPDVLTCLANLSSDEVFTPPTLVNDMLDMLPIDIWFDPTTTFLDPVSKSGVFLREIADKLIWGLEDEIPDLQERIDHILTKQIFGIGITNITGLISRRSLYCSKTANGEFSICTKFDNDQGNIVHNRVEHDWHNRKCTFCRASQETYDRDIFLENHAYQFIHTSNPEEIFKMNFDVIIGNPPYQLNDGGGQGSSAIPIYHKFIEQAKKLNPKYLSMIVPSRWFSGGRGLDAFRDEMLHDERIRIIHDYINSNDCFPGVEIKGGVNYFLWNRDKKGLCKVFSHQADQDIVSVSERKLLEDGAQIFIRYNDSIPILKKIQSFEEEVFSSIVSANDPFGFDVRIKNSMRRLKPKYKNVAFENSISFYYNGWRKTGLGYVDKKNIRRNIDWVNKYKILIPKAFGTGSGKTDLIKPLTPKKQSCCTETYLVIGPFDSKNEVDNVNSYIKTKFFHFMVSLKKNTQNSTQHVYEFVPMQDFNESWNDEKLYKKYNLTNEEIAFIESMIRPMELNK